MLEFWKPPTMDEIRSEADKKLFTVVSTFAGAGGSSTAYRYAGGNILGINEFVESRQAIYSKNWPTTPIWPEDIRTLTGEEILRRVGLKKGELDVLDGSPPCSDFSTNKMGKRESSWGNEKQYSNKVQRVDDLFYEFARVLKEVQPKVFIAENVKGLTVGNAKSLLGEKTRKLDRFGIEFDDDDSKLLNGMDETIIETLRACGYKVSYQVMNASHYGSPQIRERLMFVGVRNDLPYNPSFPRPTSIETPILGKHAIGDLLFNGAGVILNPETMTYRYVKEYFPPHTTKNYIIKFMKRTGIKTYAHRFHRDNWNKVYYTIVARDGNNVIHPLVDRYSGVFEAQRIQAFPDDYDFLQSPFKRIKVSMSDLMNEDFQKNHRIKWFDAGWNSGSIPDICKLAGWKFDKVKDQKVFILDLMPDHDFDPKKYIHSGIGWEAIGRATSLPLHSAVAKHVYENVLKPLKEKEGTLKYKTV